MARVQDRILVFHRGVGTERLEGLLMGHKAGLLAAYLAKAAHACLLAPLAALAARLRALLTGAPLPDPEEVRPSLAGHCSSPPPPPLESTHGCTTRMRLLHPCHY